MSRSSDLQDPKPSGERSPQGKGGLGRASQAAGHRAFGAGLTMAVSVTAFAFLGIWLDERAGTKPWFTLLSVLFAMAGGFLHVIRAVAPELLPTKKTTRTPTEKPEPAAPNEAQPTRSDSSPPRSPDLR